MLKYPQEKYFYKLLDVECFFFEFLWLILTFFNFKLL